MGQDMPEVDARGLLCPLPLLKAKKALNALPGGSLLRVLATDTGSARDFRVFCEQSGTVLVESCEADGVYTYVLRKRAG
jgi:TusA-related sulfurtransferase